MRQCCIDEDRIWTIWNWCLDEYLRNGRTLKFPPKTDPHNTYQWRYITAIAKKFEDWDFDDVTCKKFLEVAARYAREQKILYKGLSVLHQSNMLDTCYKLLQEEQKNNGRNIASLQSAHNWVMSRCNGSNPVDILLYRRREGALCNLTQWHKARRIPDHYMAISKVCCKALAELARHHPWEREMLPPQIDLHLLRRDMSHDVGTLKKIRKILGDQWRHSCL